MVCHLSRVNTGYAIRGLSNSHPLIDDPWNGMDGSADDCGWISDGCGVGRESGSIRTPRMLILVIRAMLRLSFILYNVVLVAIA